MLQSCLVFKFQVNILNSVGINKTPVRSRVEALIVYAVHNTRKLSHLRTGTQKLMKSLAEIFVLNFIGICTADGSNHIRIDNAALHEIHRVIIFQIAIIEIFPVKPEDIRHNTLVKYTLVLEVMNRKYASDRLITSIPDMLKTEKDRHQSRMPVVGMKNIREEIQHSHGCQNSTAEK